MAPLFIRNRIINGPISNVTNRDEITRIKITQTPRIPNHSHQPNFITFSTPILYLLAIMSFYICFTETNIFERTTMMIKNSDTHNFIKEPSMIETKQQQLHVTFQNNDARKQMNDLRQKRDVEFNQNEIFNENLKRENNDSIEKNGIFINTTISGGAHQEQNDMNLTDDNSIGYFNLFDNYTSDYDEDDCQSLDCMSYEDYVEMVRNEVMTLSAIEWTFVGAHTIVFIVGIVGNALVCVAVYRNHSMRTVTNYFIVNLAVADFMVIFFCLPPTVIWDTMHTWFFGVVLCKVVLYLQNVSVTVSVLTLTFISIDRWYAICYPLKFKSTTGRAKTCIIIIWLIALSTDIPELIVLTTVKPPVPNITEIYYTQCDAKWSQETDNIWNVSRTIILYFLPLVFMSFAYCQIVRVLWRTDNALHTPNDHQRCPQHRNHDNGNTRGVQCSANASRRSTFVMNTNTTTEGQLRSRRKAAKMLVAVVIMFAVCCFPVHLVNLTRGFLLQFQHSEIMASLILFTHWLIYANSAVNPLIYNFMSGKFRREFRRAFAQCHCVKNQIPTSHQYTLSHLSPHSTKSHYVLPIHQRQAHFALNNDKHEINEETTRLYDASNKSESQKNSSTTTTTATRCSTNSLTTNSSSKRPGECKSIYRDVRRHYTKT